MKFFNVRTIAFMLFAKITTVASRGWNRAPTSVILGQYNTENWSGKYIPFPSLFHDRQPLSIPINYVEKQCRCPPNPYRYQKKFGDRYLSYCIIILIIHPYFSYVNIGRCTRFDAQVSPTVKVSENGITIHSKRCQPTAFNTSYMFDSFFKMHLVKQVTQCACRA